MEDAHGQSSLSDLDDGLLTEILSRIRSTRKAFQCKLVCKRWCSLVSTPYFVVRFRFRANLRMIEHGDDINSSDQSLGIIVSPMAPRQSSTSIFALAYCNDLILCQSFLHFHLSNPFTKQWVAVKPLPREFSRISYGARFGLVYELAADNYSVHRYRVVRFDGAEVTAYHSETSQWVRSHHQRLAGEDMFGSEIIAYNGKLVWVNTNGTRLCTYDPFNTEQGQQISSVDGPCLGSDCSLYHGFHVGKCGGVLRIIATEEFFWKYLKVWDLETDQDGRRSWSLKHTIPEHCMPFSDAKVVGFGRKKDVVFLQSDHRLVSYNVRNREANRVERDDGSHLPKFHTVFQLQLPLWPTTLIPIV